MLWPVFSLVGCAHSPSKIGETIPTGTRAGVDPSGATYVPLPGSNEKPIHRRANLAQAEIEEMQKKCSLLHLGMSFDEVSSIAGPFEDDKLLTAVVSGFPLQGSVSFNATNVIFVFEFFKPENGPFTLQSWRLIGEKEG